MLNKSRLGRIAAGIAIGFAMAHGYAQTYPTKPVHIIIGYTPGTGVDIVGRHVGEMLAKSMGQPFIAENRPGAAGTIAAAYVATASADGYLLLVDSSSHTSVPAVMPSLPYGTLRDFAGVTTLVENPLVLVASRAKGYQTIRDLVAAGKAKPGSLSYATTGFGSSTHISAEKFRMSAGFDALHVPVKSTTEAITELMGGRMDFTYTALTTGLPGIQGGRLVALAMSNHRSALLPGVPTIEEAGFPNSAYSSWLGMMVAAKTPRDIVNRLHQEIVKAMAVPEMQERLAKIGAQPSTMSPDEFDALRRRELAANMQLMKAIGIKAQ